MTCVGIPRAGYYHQFGSLWLALFNALNFKVRVSAPTDRRIFEQGARAVINEFCLPLKIYYGHLLTLVADPAVDFILVPNFTYTHRQAATQSVCPHWLGAPDMAKTLVPVKRLARLDFNPYDLKKPAYLNGRLVPKAYWQEAVSAYRKETASRTTVPPEKPSRLLALVGHPYLLRDHFLNLDIAKRLKRAGYDLLYSDTLSLAARQQGYGQLKYRQHWQNANTQSAALLYFSRLPAVRGLILLTPFLCGVNFLIPDLIIKGSLTRDPKPVLSLVLDENLSSTYLSSRLEAFLDILPR